MKSVTGGKSDDKKSERDDFDFDKWAKLSREDPAEFERRRTERLEHALTHEVSAQNQEKLRKMQWKLDQQRKKNNKGMAFLMMVFREMMDIVHRRGGFLDSIQVLAGKKPTSVIMTRVNDETLLETNLRTKVFVLDTSKKKKR